MSKTTTTVLSLVYGNLGTNEPWSNGDYGANLEKIDAALAPIGNMTAFGTTLIEAANAGAAQTALGATTVGKAVFTAADAAAAQTALGISAYVQTLLDDANAAAARTTLGGGAKGTPVFTAADQAALLAALGITIQTATPTSLADGLIVLKYTA